MKRTKLLALALAACMILSLLPFRASAAVVSGPCGENVVWRYDTEAKHLSITGTGEMDDFLFYSIPWSSVEKQILSVTVGEGVTSIGNYAFYNASAMTAISLPQSLRSIGTLAFFGCQSLQSVVIPDDVSAIGSNAFELCFSLSSVTLPANLTAVPDYIFEDCTSLTTVEIPAGVTAIGSSAFLNCTSLKTVNIPASVQTIGEGAFDGCSQLTAVAIPSGVTRIERYTFYDCTNLASLTIPNTVTDIAGEAFSICRGLTNLTIPASVKTIGEYAFAGCTGLKQITFQGSAPQISGNAFYRVTSAAVCPAGDSTWNEETMVGYGGELTWSAVRTKLDNVVVTSVNPHTSGIILSWNAVDGADLYQIYRLRSGETVWTLLKNTRSLAYKDEAAEVGVRYYYKIVARNGDLRSSIATTASVTGVRPPSRLDNVTMRSALGHKTGNIVYWNAVENAVLYQVYRRAADETGWTLLTNTGSTGYKDTSAEVGVKYYYKVVARNGQLKSSLDIAGVSAIRP